jgi:hypothetical protein
MTTEQLITRVKPDPRGRLAFSKAIDAINRLLSTSVSGFDVLLNDEDKSLTLRPTVEVPASRAVVLSPKDWAAFTEIINSDEAPNAALMAAARRHRNAISSGQVTSAMKSETVSEAAAKESKRPDNAENHEHHGAPEHREHHKKSKTHGKHRVLDKSK